MDIFPHSRPVKVMVSVPEKEVPSVSSPVTVNICSPRLSFSIRSDLSNFTFNEWPVKTGFSAGMSPSRYTVAGSISL